MLAGVELVRMQRHIAECRSCAAQDVRVRRALLLVHSLSPIEPSPDFARRLEERIRLSCPRGAADHLAVGGPSNFRRVAAVGAFASLVMLGYIGETLHRESTPPRDIALSPVVAMAQAPQPRIVSQGSQPHIVSSAVPSLVASMSAGMPIWSAALLAEEAPVHFAGAAQTLVNYTEH